MRFKVSDSPKMISKPHGLGPFKGCRGALWVDNRRSISHFYQCLLSRTESRLFHTSSPACLCLLCSWTSTTMLLALFCSVLLHLGLHDPLGSSNTHSTQVRGPFCDPFPDFSPLTKIRFFCLSVSRKNGFALDILGSLTPSCAVGKGTWVLALIQVCFLLFVAFLPFLGAFLCFLQVFLGMLAPWCLK
jgi:hypothetical protein